MARLKTEGLNSFLYSIQQRTHARPCTVSPSIGFEFEIPCDLATLEEMGCVECEEDLAYSEFLSEPARGPLEPFSPEWLRDRGFISHFEEGGLEVGSPVHWNIAQARATAKALIEEAMEVPWLNPSSDYESEYTHCGIHVHAGVHRSMNETVPLSEFVSLILNRESSADFLWAFSHRAEYSEYGYQGRSTRWDCYEDGHNNSFHNSSVVMNGVDSMQGTLEYRMCKGLHHRLIPAIELAHSMTRWAVPLYDNNEEIKDKLIPSRYAGGSQHLVDYRCDNARCQWLKEIVPTLSQYKEWLMKQPGYKTLKSEPAMALI